MTRPRVLHVIPMLFSPDGNLVGGGERYALELARHSSRVTPTTLVSFGDRPSSSRIEGLRVEILRAPWHVRGQVQNPVAPKLFKYFRQADVVHCHQRHVLTSSLLALTGIAMRKPVFVTDHGGGGWDLSAYIDTARWYRGILHVSQYSRRVAAHEALSNSRVIYGGVDVEKFIPDPASRHDGPVVFVGRLLPHKGIDVLIRACGDDIPLDIIGRPRDSSYETDLRGLVRGDKVRFIPDADDAAIIKSYQNARCVVLPSVYKTMYGQETRVPELLGQTLIEAMACGTPAICSDVASMPEVVEHESTGFVVPPGDAGALRERLMQLGSDPTLVGRMGLAARERVERLFNWSTVVQRCMEAYRG